MVRGGWRWRGGERGGAHRNVRAACFGPGLLRSVASACPAHQHFRAFNAGSAAPHAHTRLVEELAEVVDSVVAIDGQRVVRLCGLRQCGLGQRGALRLERHIVYTLERLGPPAKVHHEGRLAPAPPTAATAAAAGLPGFGRRVELPMGRSGPALPDAKHLLRLFVRILLRAFPGSLRHVALVLRDHLVHRQDRQPAFAVALLRLVQQLVAAVHGAVVGEAVVVVVRRLVERHVVVKARRLVLGRTALLDSLVLLVLAARLMLRNGAGRAVARRRPVTGSGLVALRKLR